MTEREFLHEISNHLATAQISIEIMCESSTEALNRNKEQLEIMQLALSALQKMGKAIENRREELTKENK